MDNSVNIIEKLMIEVFNDILKIEETVLKSGRFSDVSITEIHTVEAIGMYKKPTTSEVAKKLRITSGTLSVAVNNLVKKGYVERLKSEEDRRVVKLGLSSKGRLLYRAHEHFHAEMIKGAVFGLDKSEEKVLAGALGKVHEFLSRTYLGKST